jgi:hypothetical protein
VYVAEITFFADPIPSALTKSCQQFTAKQENWLGAPNTDFRILSLLHRLCLEIDCHHRILG